MENAENKRWRQALLNPLTTFHDLARISSESPAMIIYLDTVSSRGGGRNIANENYARELFELFCHGVDNGYDQADIVEMSKVWTGWQIRLVDPANEFDPFAPQSTTILPGSTNTSTTVISNLAGVWARNLPYPSQILYLPQNVNSAGSAAYLRDEYARMLGDIEAVAGRAVTEADLRLSVAVFNENRRHLRDVYAIKRDTPWLLPVDQAYVLVALGPALPRSRGAATYVVSTPRAPGRVAPWNWTFLSSLGIRMRGFGTLRMRWECRCLLIRGGMRNWLERPWQPRQISTPCGAASAIRIAIS